MQIFADSNNVYYTFNDKYKNKKSQTSFEEQNTHLKSEHDTKVIPETLNAKEISAQYSNASSAHLTQEILNNLANHKQSQEAQSFSLEESSKFIEDEFNTKN